MAGKWKYKTGTVRGGYGETDFDAKTITIDKKKHKRAYKRITPNKDGTEKMAVTIKHELLHKQHPDWNEAKIEKVAKEWMKKAQQSQKKKLYAKFKT